jgi:hypothetical protein
MSKKTSPPTIAVLIHLRDQVPDFQAYLNQISIEAQTLGATHLIIVDQTQYHIAQYFQTDKLKLKLVDSLEAAEKNFPKLTPIYLEPQRVTGRLTSTPLPDLKHPPDVLYITGPDPASLPTQGREKAIWVHIPMATENGVFYAQTALILTLYDRLVKSQRKPQNK